MDLPDQAIPANQVTRGHACHRKVTSGIPCFINDNRIINRIALEEIEGILVDIIDADRHHAKSAASNSLLSRFRAGKDSLHGPHQLAQKST